MQPRSEIPPVTFRDVAGADDLPAFEAAMRALARDLGDGYAMPAEALARALLGAPPAARGVLARAGPETLGAAMVSPQVSTKRGAAGAFVSDLWVARSARGYGLGQRLLAEAARRARTLWQAEWLALAVYDGQPAARRFYERLGMRPQNGAVMMQLDRAGFARLTEETT
ncbi:GNAT family N-acetyltransferase [Roseovarius salinarum]|uniref:GNAT family N-acetyltransferase n=1 Tax=Roseovarius salinarum TaxID=1981892 RepID=UPI001E52E9C5|nr:GNAT family N-acetyltransferase [Roseovarius salinarum]